MSTAQLRCLKFRESQISLASETREGHSETPFEIKRWNSEIDLQMSRFRGTSAPAKERAESSESLPCLTCLLTKGKKAKEELDFFLKVGHVIETQAETIRRLNAENKVLAKSWRKERAGAEKEIDKMRAEMDRMRDVLVKQQEDIAQFIGRLVEEEQVNSGEEREACEETDKEISGEADKISQQCGPIYYVSDRSDLERKLSEAGDSLVVVSFCATWCRICQGMADNVTTLALELEGESVLFLEVNCENNQAMLAYYGVTVMPTFLLIKNKVTVGESIGADERHLKKLVLQFSTK